jgi:hypothetical protein
MTGRGFLRFVARIFFGDGLLPAYPDGFDLPGTQLPSAPEHDRPEC